MFPECADMWFEPAGRGVLEGNPGEAPSAYAHTLSLQRIPAATRKSAANGSEEGGTCSRRGFKTRKTPMTSLPAATTAHLSFRPPGSSPPALFTGGTDKEQETSERIFTKGGISLLLPVRAVRESWPAWTTKATLWGGNTVRAVGFP